MHFDIISNNLLPPPAVVVLLVDHNHMCLSVYLRVYKLAVVAWRNVASVTSDVRPTHKHTTKQQIVFVKLRDIRELGKVDSIAVSKSVAL